MANIIQKCPHCGGTLQIKDGETLGVCDFCGSTVSLAEINRAQSRVYEAKTVVEPKRKKGKKEIVEYESALSVEEIETLSFEELYGKIELALETEEWYTAEEYCDEIIRRNPKNGLAYLYKLLADLRIYKKEELANRQFPFDENENYRLFERFADGYLLLEIQGYNEIARKKAEQVSKSKEYAHAVTRMEHAVTSADYRNAALIFNGLGEYKDASDCERLCLKRADEIERKNARKKLIKWCIALSVIVAIVLISVISSAIKKAKYDVSKIGVSIVNVEKEYDGQYYIYFDYLLENDTGADIDYIRVKTTYYDSDGKNLGNITSEFGGFYSSSMDLAAGTTQRHETYVSAYGNPSSFFVELYNANINEFTVTHTILSVSFSDGENYFSE